MQHLLDLFVTEAAHADLRSMDSFDLSGLEAVIQDVLVLGREAIGVKEITVDWNGEELGYNSPLLIASQLLGEGQRRIRAEVAFTIQEDTVMIIKVAPRVMGYDLLKRCDALGLWL